MTIAWAKTRGMSRADRFQIDLASRSAHYAGRTRSVDDIDWDVPTRGTVYGTLLNYRGALAALGNAIHEPPYHAPPQAPVLYLKPSNTWIAHLAPIPLPDGIVELEAGIALGIVIGSSACRVDARHALDFVAGYTVVNDVSEPHASLYRPAVRQRCRDGFCAIGPWVLPRREVPSPDALSLRIFVNGDLRAQNTTANLIRAVAQLVADVSQFMTLFEGDVLLTGIPENAPRIKLGDHVRAEIEGIGVLANSVVGERELRAGAGR